MRNKNMITLVSIMILISILIMPVQNVSAYFENEDLNQEIKVDEISEVRNYEPNEALQVDDEVVAKEVVNSDSDVVVSQVSYQANTAYSGNGFNLSKQDMYDLARVVHGEARGESFTGQVAIAAVVLNRLKSDKFGNTVQEIIYEPGAFTAVADGQYYLEPNATAYQAVEAALKGWDPTGGAIYYWNPVTATSKWVWSRTIINQIGKHVFAI
ncbi:MAG: spore cortex-lytic enzyme [Syntrophomonadaceae bacterium]|nr:spore cortex-lytic enzyme [Syntrophomonadaceae bacterium]